MARPHERHVRSEMSRKCLEPDATSGDSVGRIQIEPKTRSVSGAGVDRNGRAMQVENALHDGETKARLP